MTLTTGSPVAKSVAHAYLGRRFKSFEFCLGCLPVTSVSDRKQSAPSPLASQDRVRHIGEKLPRLMFGNNASPLPKPLDEGAGVSRKR